MRVALGLAASVVLSACNGPTGQAGPAGSPGLTWRGPWDASQAYAPGEVVESAGSAWVAVSASTGARPPASAWNVLAAATVAQSVEVSRVVDPLAVSGIGSAVAVSGIADPVAVSGIANPVAVSGIAAPVDVQGIASPVAVSGISAPVRVETGYSGLDVNVRNSSIPVTNYWGSPLSVTGSVSVSGGVSAYVAGGTLAVTPPDMNASWILTGDNDGGTAVTCPAAIAPYASACRRVAGAFPLGLIVTDLTATARDDAAPASAGRMAFAYAAASDTAAPRWKVALRYVEVQGGSPPTFASVTRSLSGARLLVASGEFLYLADSGDAILTWSAVRR